MSESEQDTKIRRWAAAHRLPDAYRDRWLELRDEGRSGILGIAEDLRLRTGQFIVAFDMLAEIAAREPASIAQILERPAVRGIVNGAGSAPGKARGLLEALRAIRFPRLQAMSDRVATQIKSLALPAGIRVVVPRDLSSDELRIELAAHGGSELKELLTRLAEKADPLCRIADALGGADEV